MLEQFVYLCIYVFCGVAEFLVEHLVRSGETEGLKTPDAAFCLWHETEEVHWQTCGETELLHALWENALLVLLGLLTEESSVGHGQ